MKTKDLTLMSLFIALMIAGAYLRIPLPFVEVTFQAFFAVIAGLILGARKAGTVLLLYLLIGLIGLPVFAKGGGLSYILIPSFGFILGFIPGSMVTGYLYHQKKLNKYLSVFFGVLTIYLIGTPYLYFLTTLYLHSDRSFFLLLISFTPYLMKDILLGWFGAFILKYLKL